MITSSLLKMCLDWITSTSQERQERVRGRRRLSLEDELFPVVNTASTPPLLPLACALHAYKTLLPSTLTSLVQLDVVQ